VSGFGHIKASTDNSDHQIGNAGIMLLPKARGKGWAQECIKMSVKYGLEILNFVEVTLGLQTRNAPMVKVMERLEWEGKKGWDDKENVDDCEYSMGRENWQ